MTAPSLLDLSQVQDALRYVLGQLAAWQDVPGRVTRAQGALQVVAVRARAEGDVTRLAALTAYQQALAGVQQQYLDSTSLLASVTRTAQAVQAGGTPNATQIADAGRLAGVMASGLTTLQSIEHGLVSEGANLTPGPGGGLSIPGWAKWGGIGLGLWWFYRAFGKRRRRG